MNRFILYAIVIYLTILSVISIIQFKMLQDYILQLRPYIIYQQTIKKDCFLSFSLK